MDWLIDRISACMATVASGWDWEWNLAGVVITGVVLGITTVLVCGYYFRDRLCPRGETLNPESRHSERDAINCRGEMAEYAKLVDGEGDDDLNSDSASIPSKVASSKLDIGNDISGGTECRRRRNRPLIGANTPQIGGSMTNAKDDMPKYSFSTTDGNDATKESNLPDLCPFMAGEMLAGESQTEEERSSFKKALVNKWDDFKHSKTFDKVKSKSTAGSVPYAELADKHDNAPASDPRGQRPDEIEKPLYEEDPFPTEITMDELGADVDIGHLPAEIKKARLRQAQNSITQKMTDEEWRDEARIRQQQMEAICQVIKQQDGFGVSAQDLEEQMKLYSF